MKKTAIFAILMLSSTVFGLQAPYLMSAIAHNDSTVTLVWRNNSVDATSFVVIRKKAGDVGFITRDSAVTGTVYTDRDLVPEGKYYYGILANSPNGRSDTSNIDSAIVPNPVAVITAVAVNCSTITVSWVDACTDISGFVLLRMGPGESQFSVLDSMENSVTSYINKPVKDSSWYSYKMVCRHINFPPDTSSIVMVQTPVRRIPIFKRPKVSPIWLPESGFVRINYTDSSENETGFNIYKMDYSGSNPVLVKTIVSNSPMFMGDDSIIDIDNEVRINNLYYYKVEAYVMGGQSLSSDTVPVYTYFTDEQAHAYHLVYVTEPLCRFPIHYDSIALKSGNSILVREKNLTGVFFSQINVQDVRNPAFKGLLNIDMPLTNALCTRDKVFARNGNTGKLSCYQYKNDSIFLIGESSQMDYPIAIPYNNIFLGYYPSACSGIYVHYFSDSIFKFIKYCPGYPTISIIPTDCNIGVQMSCNLSYYNKKVSYNGSWSCCIYAPRYPPSCHNGTFDSSFDYSNPLSPSGTSDLASSYMYVDGFPTQDSIFFNARQVFIDTIGKYAFVITDTLLSIYSYDIRTIRTLPPGRNASACLRFSVFPNPVKSRAMIVFPRTERSAKLAVFNSLGKRITVLEIVPGQDRIVWNIGVVPAGIYFIRGMISGRVFSEKILLQK
jgi:hypothetical protein